MQDGPSNQFVPLTFARRVSRRTTVSLAAKIAGGAALTVITGARLAQVATAQDGEIILTAAASEVGARPGSAYAQGNAALAAADQDTGAITVAAGRTSTASPGGGAPEVTEIVPPSAGGGTSVATERTGPSASAGGGTSEATESTGPPPPGCAGRC
jgi:hypothetical protein